VSDFFFLDEGYATPKIDLKAGPSKTTKSCWSKKDQMKNGFCPAAGPTFVNPARKA